MTATSGLRPGRRRIFVDTWSAGYGSPNQIDDELDEEAVGEIIPEEGFAFVVPTKAEPFRVAFVDGVRRQEAALSQWVDAALIPGIAGSHGVGAVIADPGRVPYFSSETVSRLVIWSGGHDGALPDLGHGWHWEPASTPEAGPKAALRSLQERMRVAEAALAQRLADEGLLVLTDGTLWASSASSTVAVAGYVKSHHRRLLPLDAAEELPHLPPSQRTTLFATDRRYSCYLRLTVGAPQLAPLSGIVRLEFSGGLALQDARVMADRFASILPAYAGVLYVDPRAPQNLQPVGALESHLRHLLGDAALAERAVRDVVALTPE